MQPFLVRLLDDTSGASFLDFRLIAAFISLLIVAIVVVLGNDMDKPIRAITSALSSSVSHP